MPYYTNSYGPLITVKSKFESDGRNSKRKGRRRISAYKQLDPKYDIGKHIYIGSSKNLTNIRTLIHVRLKEKSVEAIIHDTAMGYVSKVGADYYIVYDQSSAEYRFYRREKSKRKVFKNFVVNEEATESNG